MFQIQYMITNFFLGYLEITFFAQTLHGGILSGKKSCKSGDFLSHLTRIDIQKFFLKHSLDKFHIYIFAPVHQTY